LNLAVKLDLLAMLNRYCQYGWTKQAICRQWGISLQTFYGIKPISEKIPSSSRIQLHTITSFEREAIRGYALNHTELNHRELAYRMLDGDIVAVSPSTVYRILKEYHLIRQRAKRAQPDIWHPHQGVTRPDRVWQTDLMCLIFQQREYYLLSYLDVYSRFTVYHQLCLTMTGDSVRQASKEAMAQTGIIPESIQSDNGSCYVSQEYRGLMKKLEIDHRLIHPHCPNENAEIERYHRTVRELVDINDATTFAELEELIKERIYYYNYIRYHSRIGFIPPYIKYRGHPDQIFAERKRKLDQAKTKRMKLNAQMLLSKTQNNYLTNVQ
jgi:transposase InsO family protein